MQKVRIWGRENSINVQKVLWACSELQVPWERMDAGGKFGGLDKPEYRAMNPNGLVPTLEDGNLVLWESNAIVRYLAARYGEGGLWPTDTVRRAVSDKWMDWQLTTCWPAVRTLFIQLIRTESRDRDADAIAAAHRQAVVSMRALETVLLEQDFLAGADLTIGDVAVGVVAHRWFTLDIDRPALPATKAWFDRLTQRPGFQSNVMKPLE